MSNHHSERFYTHIAVRPFLSFALALVALVGFSAFSRASEPLDSSRIQKGKKILSAQNCTSCHSVNRSGGCLAPPFDGIGSRRGKEFILARITDSPASIAKFSRLYQANELMPHRRLPRVLAEDVAAYLVSIPSPKGGLQASPHKVRKVETAKLPASKLSLSQDAISTGKKLFYTKGCMECHSVFGAGGQFAPGLDGIAQRRDRASIAARISGAELLLLGVGGEYHEKGTVMPPSNLTDAERNSITEFLLSLPARKN